MADFLPTDPDELKTWITAYLAKQATVGATIGITPADQAATISLGAAAILGIDNAKAAENAYDSALEDRTRLVGEFAAFIRPLVRRAKTHSSYTPTAGEALGIIGESTQVPPDSIKPTLTVVAQMGSVRVRVRRKGAQSVNLYVRIAGQVGWTFVTRMNRASYEDTRPLAQPGVPEIREYMVQGVIGDEPVGLPSDPKIVIFAGELAA